MDSAEFDTRVNPSVVKIRNMIFMSVDMDVQEMCEQVSGKAQETCISVDIRSLTPIKS